MNRSWLLLIISSIVINVFGQTVVKVEKSGGVYMIPCVVNGALMKMVFDTGASTVTISMEKAKELLKQGRLKEDDFLGFGQSLTASGDMVDHLEINLRTIRIGETTIKNTRAVIISGQNAPLLLGLSAIQKLGKISIDDNRLIIATSDSPYNGLRAQISDCISKSNYSQAIKLLHKIRIESSLNEEDICDLILCYSRNKQYEDCLRFCKIWIEDYENNDFKNRRFVYEQICFCLYKLKAYKETITWINRTIEQIQSEDLKSHYVAQMGSCYFFLSELDLSFSCYYKSTQMRLKYLGVKEDDILKNKVNDKILGEWYQRISMNYAVLTNNQEKAIFFAILGAKCGNLQAIEFCKYSNINYK